MNYYDTNIYYLMYAGSIIKITRNTFYGTRYLSHCCVLFALKHSFFNILKGYWSTKVPLLPDFGSHD